MIAQVKKILLFSVLCFLFSVLSGCSSQYQAERLYWQASQTAKEIIQNKTLDKLSSEDYRELIAAYRQVVEGCPLDSLAAQSQFIIAQLNVLQDEYSQAQQELLKITQNFSSNAEIAARAQFMIGNLYERQGDWEKAVREYEKIIDLYPLSSIGLKTPIYIAQHYKQVRQESQAEKAFAEAVKNYEKIIGDFYGTSVVPIVMDHIALTYLNQGKWDEAIEVWQKIADEHSQSPMAAKSLLASGQIYTRQIRDLQKAIKAYEDFVEQYPKSRLAKQINFQIGRLYFIKGDTEKARQCFLQLIKDYPDEKNLGATARIALAECYERQGENSKAIEEYNKIRKDYPDTRQALAAPFFIARNYLIYQKDNQKADAEFAQAISEYKDIIENETRIPVVLETGRLISLCHIVQKQWEEAINCLQVIVDKYPSNAVAQIFLLDIAGIYQKELDKPQEAIKIYEELINKFPANHSLANLAKAQLKILQTDTPKDLNIKN